MSTPSVSRSAMLGMLGAAVALPRQARAQSAAIRWGVLPGEESALPYYAQQKGFFRNAGIEVGLTIFRDGGSVTQGVVAGALDLGVTNSGSMSLAHVRGLPLTLVQCGSLYTQSEPIAHLSVLKGSPIRTGKDLNGKTVAVSTLHDMMQAVVMAWIDRNGGDSKSVNFVEIPVIEQAAAVTSRRVDAASIVEPAYSRAKTALTSIGLPYSACAGGRPFQTLGFIGNRDWVARNAALAKRVSAALAAAARYINANPAEASTMLVAYAKLAPDVVSLYPRIRFAESNDPALIQPVIDLLNKYAFMDKQFAAADLFEGKD